MPEMDMRRMQEEAARRAREMQSRARPGRQRAANQVPEERPAPEPPPPPEQPAEKTAPAAPLAPAAGEAPQSLLEELFKDGERTMLLALLLMLGGEDGNNELMFALMFLLM